MPPNATPAAPSQGRSSPRLLALVPPASCLGLLRPCDGAAGVAFGGMARSLLQPLLQEAEGRGAPLREQEDLCRRALPLVQGLIDPWLGR